MMAVQCSANEQTNVINASDLRLVPFPKQVTPEAGAGFSLKTKLQLRVAAKDREVLGASLLEELKRAGFPEPQLIENDSDKPCVIIRIWNSENKSYWLDWTTKKYDELDTWYEQLQQKIRDVRKNVSKAVKK